MSWCCGSAVAGAARAARLCPSSSPGDIDAALDSARRVVVVGSDADLATVLTRLLRADRLDVEVATSRAAAPGHPGLPLAVRRRAARRARGGSTQRVPLIRDETGTVIVGAANWLPPGERPLLARRGRRRRHGAVRRRRAGRADRADDGAARVAGERADRRMRSRRWVTGRAAQLGGTGDHRGARRRRRATARPAFDVLSAHRGLVCCGGRGSFDR